MELPNALETMPVPAATWYSEGQKAAICADVDVQVKAGTCLQIFCSGEDACTGLSVTLEQDSNCWYTKTTDAAAPQGCQEAGEGEGCALVQEAAPKRHAAFGFQK